MVILGTKATNSNYVSVNDEFYNFARVDKRIDVKGVHERTLLDEMYGENSQDMDILYDEFRSEDERVFRGEHLSIFYVLEIENALKYLFANKYPHKNMKEKIVGATYQCVEIINPSIQTINNFISNDNIIIGESSLLNLKKFNMLESNLGLEGTLKSPTLDLKPNVQFSYLLNTLSVFLHNSL